MVDTTNILLRGNEMSKLSENKLAEIGKYLAGVAGVPCEVEQINAVIYVFCSELGALRLLECYRTVKHTRKGYSKNMNSHYFMIDTDMDATLRPE